MTTPPPSPAAGDDAVIDRDGIAYAYLQVADVIDARIAAGRYLAKLPAERDLAAEFGVSYITVRHSMAILRERGLIVSIHGRGTYVAPGHRTLPGQHRYPGPRLAEQEDRS